MTSWSKYQLTASEQRFAQCCFDIGAVACFSNRTADAKQFDPVRDHGLEQRRLPWDQPVQRPGGNAGPPRHAFHIGFRIAA